MAKRVLVCDDAAFMRMMIKDILTKNGYEVAGEAEKIGISRTHMSNIEAPNMLTPVSLEVIFEIADALNIKPEVLFVMSDE